MEDKNIILINKKEYSVIDTIEKMTVPDCFVVASNTIGKGHGEAKFYINTQKNSRIFDFFGDKKFNVNCFIRKDDLYKYMNDIKEEYYKPDQNYKKKSDFPKLWNDRLTMINNLNEIEYFNLISQNQIKGDRFYVNSDKKENGRIRYIGYQILREISLPKITYLAVLKLKDNIGNIIFYFRLFIDYFGEIENKKVVDEQIKKIEESVISNEVKMQLTRARVGQGKYRQELLEKCPFCPITMVSDDRLLIASHIKPWTKSNDVEKVDSYNGFMFTPNIDLLFDRGFITFTNDKRMIVSPWLSKMTCSKLNIIPNKKYEFLPVDGRENYLEYHRNEIFKS